MLSYEKYEQENGVYIMNIFWKFVIWDFALNYRDALWITDVDTIDITAMGNSDLFIFEVPMH